MTTEQTLKENVKAAADLPKKALIYAGLAGLMAGFIASAAASTWFAKDEVNPLEQKVVILDMDKVYSSVYRYLENKGVSDEAAQKRAVEALKGVEKYASALVDKGYLVLNGRTVVVAPKGMDKTAEVLSDVLEKLDDAGHFAVKAN